MASSLSLLFSHRAVIVAGGILSTAAMVLASLDLGLPWMYCSLGVLQGRAYGLLKVVPALETHFESVVITVVLYINLCSELTLTPIQDYRFKYKSCSTYCFCKSAYATKHNLPQLLPLRHVMYSSLAYFMLSQTFYY